MSDLTAVPLEAQQEAAPLATSVAGEAKALAAGLLYTAAVAAVGTLAVIGVLLVGVVAAPLLVAIVASAVLRRRARERTGSRRWSPARG